MDDTIPGGGAAKRVSKIGTEIIDRIPDAVGGRWFTWSGQVQG